MLDFHLHCWTHGPGTPTPSVELIEQYCEAAEPHGITQLAFTEHAYRFERVVDEVLPHWERSRTGGLADATDHIIDVERGGDLDAYIDVLHAAQDKGLPVLIGLEVDHLPGATDAMATLLADYPLDVVLGSVHWLDAWLFDDYGNPVFAEQWETRDVDDIFSAYVDSILELATSGLTDVLAHLDVIKVAGHVAPRLREHEDRLVAGLAQTDMVIEFSSAGLRKPVGATYPALDLFDRLIEAGLRICTASDAHTVEHVGHGFDVLRAELDQRKIESLTSFSRRKAVRVQRKIGA